MYCDVLFVHLEYYKKGDFMGKSLYIAEKPSVAQEFAKALHLNVKRKDGYLEADDAIVTWCIGHLAGVANASAYNPDYAYWRYEHLPIIPDKWQNSLRKKTYQHFQLLKKTMQKSLKEFQAHICR